MLKKEYFNRVLRETELWRDLEWLVSILSYRVGVGESRDFDIRYERGVEYYLDGRWERIEGVEEGERGLFLYNERVVLDRDTLENCPVETETTVGRALMNKIMLCYPFRDKIGYINKRFMPRDVESIIRDRLEDTPIGESRDRDPSLLNEDDISHRSERKIYVDEYIRYNQSETNGSTDIRDHGKIYVDEYIKYNDACLFLSQLCQVCVPGVTEKAITPPPGSREYLQRLIDEKKAKGESLHDAAVIAEIGSEMERMDQDYMRGDRSLGFLISKKKDFGIVRKKMYLMYGFDKGFTEGSEVDFIDRPLCDGYDYRKLDSYINGSRAGSFSRGAETQLGGVAVKELLRSSSNCSVMIEDCQSGIGIPTYIDESNIDTYIGFYCYIDGIERRIDRDNKDKYIGRVVEMRSPAYCRCEGTGFCAKCSGPHLSLHETGISSAVSAMGSVFLNTFMKAMHGKQLATVELNMDTLLS